MFTNSGITSGGTLLIHSSLSRTMKQTGHSQAEILQFLLDALGPKGTLLLPLFNLGFTKGSAFDIRSTQSEMGILTECGRTWPNAVRTGHPIYSFAAIGAQAHRFATVNNLSAYGADSPFSMLREMDGDIGVIDLPDQNSMTFYHHVEEMQNVPYRFHKNFTGTYTDHFGRTEKRTYKIFVRDMENGVVTRVNRMGELLWDRGLYKGERPGIGTGLRIIKARGIYNEVKSIIDAGKAKDFLYDVEN